MSPLGRAQEGNLAGYLAVPTGNFFSPCELAATTEKFWLGFLDSASTSCFLHIALCHHLFSPHTNFTKLLPLSLICPLSSPSVSCALHMCSITMSAQQDQKTEQNWISIVSGTRGRDAKAMADGWPDRNQVNAALHPEGCAKPLSLVQQSP